MKEKLYFTITAPTVGVEDKEVQRLLQNFCNQFVVDMLTAKISGAFEPDDFTQVEIARAVIVISAEKFGPMSKENKALLANLRHFV